MMTSGLYGYMQDYLLWVILFVSLLVHTWCFFKFFPRAKRPGTALVLGNALILLCMLGGIALLAETHLRFVSVKTDAFGMTWAAQRWFLLHTEFNSLGCRDKEWTRVKPPGVRRIAFVGDSFTYGWGIERVEDRFPDRVEARLNASGAGRFEVLNVAKPGWDTADQLQPISDMIEHYALDEVVLCYVPNDIEDLLPISEGFNPTLPPQPVFFNTSTSALVDYLYRRVYTPYLPSVRGYHDWLAAGYADEDLWRRQRDRLGAIIQLCRDRGVTLRVVLLPYILTGGERYNAQAIHALLTEFFEANGTEVLDLLPVLAGHDRQTLVVNRDDPHPNEKANELFATRIAERLY
jgi:lysophospholipase L1-like esterase